MARFGLIGGNYKSQSPNADCEQTVNWYPEKIESPDGKSAMALYPCPGISLFASLTDAPIRAFLLINGRMFTIAGGTTIDNTSGAPQVILTNNAQAWNGDFTFTGSNALSLGAGAVSMSGSIGPYHQRQAQMRRDRTC